MDRILLMEQKAMALGCRCRRDEPMARHTTFKIGGPADLLVTAETLSSFGAFWLPAGSWNCRCRFWAMAPTCWYPTRVSGVWSSSWPETL